MSSLAATQADGYYVPVEYYESGSYKKQSKNQWAAKQQPNGTGKKPPAASTVRFELPYDGVCESCGSYIKRGTRYNATKAKVGDYFSTPIYEFRMSCRACPSLTSQEFTIRVNPSSFGFDYLKGIRKHCRDFEAEPDDHCVPVAAREEGPFTDVERMEIQQDYLQHRSEPDLKQLQAMLDHRSRNFHDAAGNAQLRTAFRSDRKRRKRQLRNGAAVGWGKGLALLEGSTLEETAASKSAVFGDCHSDDRRRWKAVRSESIFDRPKSSSGKSERAAVGPDEVPSASGQGQKSLTRRRHGRDGSGQEMEMHTPSTAGEVTAKKRRIVTVLPPFSTKTSSSVVSWEKPLEPSVPQQPPSSSISTLLANYPSSSDGEE
jgi:hypothetical protein